VEIADIDRLIAALGEAQATIADLRAQLATSESVRALETKTLQQVTADLESARAEVGQPSRNYWEALNMLRAERDAARHDLGRAREERNAAREAHEEAAASATITDLRAAMARTESDPPQGSRCWRAEVELGKARDVALAANTEAVRYLAERDVARAKLAALGSELLTEQADGSAPTSRRSACRSTACGSGRAMARTTPKACRVRSS
jgi:hypothetical protein